MNDDFPQRVSYHEALRIIAGEASLREPRRERVALSQATGRVLADDLHASLDVPGFDNAAMDGFAIRHSALAQGRRDFIEIGQQWAGQARSFDASDQACVRITTGAPMPDGFDTVIIKEQCEVLGEHVRLNEAAMRSARGANIRSRGEDARAGECLLTAGSMLTPLQVSVAAAQGIAHLSCHAKPTVAILTTGDEIVPPGQELAPGQIHDSNRALLQGLLREQGIEAVAWPAVRDDPASLRAALTDLTESFDVVLTCGGVSAGDRDHLPALLRGEGKVAFWKARIKPGMPVLLGAWNRAMVMGLPGNPVSVFATFHTLAVPLLRGLQGADGQLPWRAMRLRAPLRKAHARLEFMRGMSEIDDDGQGWVHADAVTGSHRLAAAARNDRLLLLEEGERDYAAGDVVPCLDVAGSKR